MNRVLKIVLCDVLLKYQMNIMLMLNVFYITGVDDLMRFFQALNLIIPLCVWRLLSALNHEFAECYPLNETVHLHSP